MWGHRGGLGTWIPVRGQFSVVLTCRKGGESPGVPRALFLPSFLPFALAQPFRLPSLAPWLCPAACPGSWGLSLQSAPCRCPLCPALPRWRESPPCASESSISTAGESRLGQVRARLWVEMGAPHWERGPSLGLPSWPLRFGVHHSPSPRRFMRCLADGCWIQHPVPSVLVSPRRNPHLHPKQG